MKKLLNSVINRILVTGLLILVQVVWLLAMFTKLVGLAPWLDIALTVLSLLFILQIVCQDDNPAYKIGWIILVTLLMPMGGLLYLCFGNKKPERWLRRRFAAVQQRTAPLLGQTPGPLEKLEPRTAATARYVARCGPWPVWDNTAADYYPIGEELYAAMLAALESAEHFIFLEYFIIRENSEMWQSILAVLERKAKQGVDVRLLYDDLGSVALLPGDYHRQMEAKGIRCVAFNPFVPFVSLVMNNRDHRKILAVDGHMAFTGGINLSDEYINRTHPHGHWKDTGVKLVGEGAWNLTLMFLETWNACRPTDESFEAFRPHTYHPGPFAGGCVQPFGDSPLDGEPLAENVYIEILAQAQEYVTIATPYLALSNEMQTALCMAAKRGVDVRVITPGIPDKKIVYRLTRSYYPALLAAGVRIYEYTPGFVHAKSYLADGKLAVVGTINMDFRSLYLHFECGALLYGGPALEQLKADCDATLAQCREVTAGQGRQSLGARLFNAVLRVLAPLF